MNKIDAATLQDFSVIWIVISRSNGLLPGHTAGHYMMRFGETIKGSTTEDKAKISRQWAQGWMWVNVRGKSDFT